MPISLSFACTEWSKNQPPSFCRNFIEYWPIFKILLLAQLQKLWNLAAYIFGATRYVQQSQWQQTKRQQKHFWNTMPRRHQPQKINQCLLVGIRRCRKIHWHALKCCQRHCSNVRALIYNSNTTKSNRTMYWIDNTVFLVYELFFPQKSASNLTRFLSWSKKM